MTDPNRLNLDCAIEMSTLIFYTILSIILYVIYRYLRYKPLNLDEKTIVLTGASSGIGKGSFDCISIYLNLGIALFVKDFKVNLFMCARSMDILEDIKQELVNSSFNANRVIYTIK